MFKWLHKNKSKSDETVLTEEEKYAIWCPASAHMKVVLADVQYSRPPEAETPKPFQSTAASQWSTADIYLKKEKPGLHDVIQYDHGSLVVRIEPLKEQARRYKLLATHPHLVTHRMNQMVRDRQSVRDSALFL